jgi:hypothetical protein
MPAPKGGHFYVSRLTCRLQRRTAFKTDFKRFGKHAGRPSQAWQLPPYLKHDLAVPPAFERP